MRRRQCRFCDPWWFERSSGKIISKKIAIGSLPGCGDEQFSIMVYTVQCTRCGRTWTYRKKSK